MTDHTQIRGRFETTATELAHLSCKWPAIPPAEATQNDTKQTMHRTSTQRLFERTVLVHIAVCSNDVFLRSHYRC